MEILEVLAHSFLHAGFHASFIHENVEIDHTASELFIVLIQAYQYISDRGDWIGKHNTGQE